MPKINLTPTPYCPCCWWLSSGAQFCHYIKYDQSLFHDRLIFINKYSHTSAHGSKNLYLPKPTPLAIAAGDRWKILPNHHHC